MARTEKRIVSALLSDPKSSGTVPSAAEERVLGIDVLRQAVRTQPAEEWCLTTASRVMYGTRDYDRVRAKTAGFNWTFTIQMLDKLVKEGLLHRPDRIRYVPTAGARRTWPICPDLAGAGGAGMALDGTAKAVTP